MPRQLDFYTAPDANGDLVIVGVIDPDYPNLRDTINGSDTALQAAAVAANRTTWGQDELCSVYGLTRKPIEAPAPMPALEPAPVE